MLGSPNPGQSFGRGLSGPQATEVKMARAEVGRLRISPYIRLIHFWVPHFGSERSDAIREMHFFMFFWVFFCIFKPEDGTWMLPVSWRNHLRTLSLCKKNSMFDVLSVLKTRRRYVKLSRAESTGIDRPALYTLTPDRPPLAACTGHRL